MIIAVVLLTILFTGLLVYLDRLGIDGVILWFASKDKRWSPFRMKPGGGHIHFYTKGKEPGGDYATFLNGFILGWWYHAGDHRFYHVGHTDEEKKFFKLKFPDGPPVPNTAWEVRLENLGVGWVGFNRRLYRRKRVWEVMDTRRVGNDKAKFDIKVKETKVEEEHIFYFSTEMALSLDKVPTQKMGSADVKVGFTTLLINPELAEFLAGKWETQAISAVRSRAKEHIASKTLEQLRNEQDTDKKDEMVDRILMVNDTQAGESATVGLIETYGVMIQSPRFEDFDFNEEAGPQEVVEALRRKAVAETNLETARIDANTAEERGKGKARERKAEAEGIAVEFAARMSVDEGAELTLAEAIREGKGNLRYLSLSQGQPSNLNIAVPAEPD